MKPFIFLHVPKTAGTTLRAIIERQYPPEQLYTVYDGAADHHSIADLEALSEGDQQPIKVFCGHFAFGVHRHLANDNLKYVTILRQPVERVISYYHHAMTMMPRWQRSPISLVKFIQARKDKQVDNFQTRLISGVDAPFGQCDESMLWKALENIEHHFALVGVSERFDESLVLLAKDMGWSNPIYVRENVGKGRPPLEYYSTTELNIVRNYNRLDSLLYSYVDKRLSQAIGANPRDFARRLSEFNTKNSVAHETISARAVWA